MSLIKSILFVLCLSIPGLAVAAENFSVNSANGFTCSQNDELVTCRGSFPDNPKPIIESTGYNVVWVRAEFPGARYTYYSDSGCLCKAGFESSGKVSKQECTGKSGKTKTFKGEKSSFDWCGKN